MSDSAKTDEDRAEVRVAADPQALWSMVSDVTSMGRWSPECYRGEWLDGATGPEVGARFKGWNAQQVGPIPVRWATTATVTESIPGEVFAFSVRESGATWTYRFTAEGDDTVVTETRRDGVKPFVAKAFAFVIRGRDEKLRHDMVATLRRLKAAAEHAQGAPEVRRRSAARDTIDTFGVRRFRRKDPLDQELGPNDIAVPVINGIPLFEQLGDDREPGIDVGLLVPDPGQWLGRPRYAEDREDGPRIGGQASGGRGPSGRVVILDGSCGIADCCGVVARIDVGATTVRWHDIIACGGRRLRRDLEFTFDRARYEAALAGLADTAIEVWDPPDDPDDEP